MPLEFKAKNAAGNPAPKRTVQLPTLESRVGTAIIIFMAGGISAVSHSCSMDLPAKDTHDLDIKRLCVLAVD
jgi:hypothetical protein